VTADAGRPAGVEPYVRGVAWPAGAGVSYPRADPADARRLPADTWSAAQLPAGVRLEIAGDARQVRVEYVTTTADLGRRGPAAGTTFEVWRDGRRVDEAAADLGVGTVRLHLGHGPGRAVVYLPEAMKPLVTKVVAEQGLIEPAPPQPRWIAYGDSIAEGWIASSPAASWVAAAGRRHGFDVVNMGYAGAARGEIVSAEQIASREADVISLTHGTNCWSMIPYSTDMMRSSTEAFLRVVRAGHPGVPLVVASPLVRPDAEDRPNRLGATQADLRRAMEEAVRAVGDDRTTLVPGRDVLSPELLGDGVHPDDAGHRVLAQVFGDAVRTAYDAATD
jgi:lysophospholipase L1-like esterase